MKIIVNGEPREQDAQTVEELLEELGFSAFVAVAVNRECVRRKDFKVKSLREGDEVEVLAPMAGG